MKNLLLIFAVFVAFVAMDSCSGGPYGPANKMYKSQVKQFAKSLRQTPVVTAGADTLNMAKDWVGTVNFGLRKPNYVIIHHTAQNSLAQTLKTFTTVSTQVSAHYVIGRDGQIHHMLNDYMRAWHAGVGKWAGQTDINSSSIGIELDNNGYEPFSDDQLNSLIKLLGNLKKTYNIPAANFIGHSDVAPGRKVDPSQFFPWKTLSLKGFGLWYDDVMETPPLTFDPVDALRIIGYDTKNLNAAISSFKLHFVQNDLSQQLTDLDKQILYNLYKKY
jgi:N-acetylmuramoyl-L-alanine amidase